MNLKHAFVTQKDIYVCLFVLYVTLKKNKNWF